MAKQDRAIRTRRAILMAAAETFEKHGYQAATITEILKIAGVTKGALYFHFPSKEELALGVIEAQDPPPPTPDQPLKLQELVDMGMLFSHRLHTSLLTRAGVRLSMDQQAQGLDRTGPFLRWQQTTHDLLAQAKQNGELLPHVNPTETADLYVAAFTGIQAVSQTLTNYRDLEQRYVTLQRHILPSIANPSILTALDLSPERTTRLARLIPAY
ncbi:MULTISPECIES: ScbR family autoregulator-binding transcription factor [Streptomyces]|uniref:ScbR family autoregulator-binding transcription factor n=1 Tax=Streptomyces TaxID=1883 RepID=UPI000F1F0630|nr:ScbR family autoregulator-binding transcription factor [Streptomyces sp. CBMAI 2042]RLV64524.1 Gamma-butyrolactone binding protein [Streptomyces sp. CBMAI 2042]